MNRKQGFTLIELLTVVMILAILTSVALPQYRRAIQRAEAADALINLKTMFDAAKRYYSYHSSWPTTLQGLDVQFLDASSTGEVGEFQYTLGTGDYGKYASACRIVNEATTNSYCLYAYYSLNGIRDVYTCKATNTRFTALCDSMGSTTATDGGVLIGD